MFVCLDILINKQYMLISMKHRPSILTASPIQIFVNQAEIGGWSMGGRQTVDRIILADCNRI